MLRVVKNILISAIFPVLFLLFWHFMARHMGNPRVLPPMQDVLDLLLRPNENLIGVGSLLRNTSVSLLRVLMGYTVAVIVAIPLGVFIGYHRLGERLLLPFLSFFRSIPPMAWVPLVLAWFGISSVATLLNIPPGPGAYVLLNSLRLSMTFIIFLGAFFPILSNVVFGIKDVSQTLINAARTMGATNFQIIRKIYLPHASPAIFTGLQVGLGTAWMCLVSAEMLPGSIAGVGFLISHAYQVTRLDVVMAGIATISIVSFTLDIGFRVLSRRLFRWKQQS